MKALTYIEIDVPDFADTSPEAISTFRFAQDTNYLPREVEAIPSIRSISFSPARISLGENLGERASLTITFTDHRHIFGGEPFEQGSFWGKWRARYGTRLRGRPLRWIQGVLGQSLGQMETRHFIIESTDGPTPGGTYTIVAKDVLKLADNDRAQAPALSNGFLVANITDTDTSATLSPAGIGDAEYPSSGHVAIGGEEICAFTRSGDTLTLTRGQLGTAAAEHESGDRVQIVLRYVGEDPADIIRDLLVNYAGVSSAYIDLPAWHSETESFLQTLYSAVIAEPSSVNKLISELIEQAALAVWWEPLTQQIRLMVLRAVATNAQQFTEENTIANSLSIKDQPGQRLSQVWTYFGQRNPLRPLDEADNFRSVAATVNLEAETEYGGPVIKKIFSRWIPFGARQIAFKLNDLLLGRFSDPPRRFNFDLWRYGPENPMLGGGYRLQSWAIQNVDGTPADAPIQITRINPMSDKYQVEADEILISGFNPADLVNRVIIIDGSINNVNLRELHDQIYPAPTVGASPAVNLTVYIEANVVIGSTAAGTPSVVVGDWPVGFPITVYLRGEIRGAGGKGGDGRRGFGDGQNGQSGGTALYTRFPIDLILNEGSGLIYGGGGGGPGGAVFSSGKISGPGGGGAGTVPGLAGTGGSDNATDGTPDEGGEGGTSTSGAVDGGDGGDPGEPGQFIGFEGSSGFPGFAGRAIDGVSFVTKTGAGNIKGPEIN
jgi:hypothetical protein